jgi:predicted nuclease of predicted toxin-antitoxin system
MTKGVRFYLDADLSPKIAGIACSLGLDVTSAQEAGLAEAEDADQLRHAAGEGRMMVTRNRDDFLALTLEAYHDQAPHAGLLLVTRAGSAHQASRVAHALRRWAATHDTPQPYTVHWLHV